MNKPWKMAEKKVAAISGGKRVGNTGTNSEDVSHSVFSFEVKSGKQIPKFIEDTMAQAKRNCPDGKIPVAAFRKKGAKTVYVTISVEELAKVCPELLLEMELSALVRLAENDTSESSE